MDLETKVLISLAKQSKTTSTLMTEFRSLGFRDEASIYLNQMYRHGTIVRESGGVWRITEKGIKVKGVADALTDEQLDAAGKDDVKSDRLAVIGESVKKAEKPKKPKKECAGQPKRDASNELPGTVGSGRLEGASYSPKLPEVEQNLSQAVTLLKNVLKDGCSLLIECDEAIAIFDGLKFRLKDPEDIDAFSRMSQRYDGRVA